MAAGRKNKYDTHVKPFLLQVAAWCRDGATDEDICKALKISKDSFYRYKKEHSELSDALKDNKEIADIRIENSLYNNALGYTYTEEQAFKCKRVWYDDNNQRQEEEELKTIEVERHKPAETTAQIFWLKNRKPKQWRDKQEIDANVNIKQKLEDYFE